MAWLWWHVVAGYERAHRLRTGVQILAIALGVALGYGVDLINVAALAEFSTALRDINGEADARVTGARTGFDEQLLARVAADPAVALASPVLEVDVPVVGTGDERVPRLTVVGLDVLRSGYLAPALMPNPADGAGRFAVFGDGIFLSPAALERFHVRVGGTLAVQVGSGTVGLPVAGTLPGAREGSVLGVMDLGFAQWRLGQLGKLTRIDLRLKPGTDFTALAARLALPAGTALAPPDAAESRLANLSRAYRVNLNVLALVALFTGAFLVFSLQAQAALARRSQLAYLRVAGVTRGELQRLLVGEALAIGTLGSMIGLGLGALIAKAALAALRGGLGGDLGSSTFGGPAPGLVVSLPATAGFALFGLAAAVVGSWLPARQAARAAPAPALRSGAEEDALQPLGRRWPGVAALITAFVLVWLPTVGGIPLAAYLAIGALIVGTIALQPRLARALFAPLAAGLRASSAAARFPMLVLAATRLGQAPGFASIAMAGIVASFALMVAMGTMVASFRGSVDEWLGKVLPADVYLRVGQAMGPGGAVAWFSPADLERIRRHPGVVWVEFSRFVPVQLAPDRAAAIVVVRPIDPGNPGATLALVSRAVPVAADEPPPVWVSEAMVDIYGVRPGGILELPLGGASHRFTVAGVWRDYARQFGSIALNDGDYMAITGDNTRTDAAIWLKPGYQAARVIADLRGSLDARAATDFNEPGDIRRITLSIFDRSFAVTYVLELAAIVIGLVGVAATFAAQAIARTREFGMLRHVGVTRGQVLRLLALEGGLATLAAIIVGLGTGLLVSLVLIDVVNPQSFHWSMEFHPPVALIATLVPALLGCAALTAVLAGRRAVAGDALRAVHEDW